MIGNDLASKLRRLVEVRERRDETKAAADIAEKEYRELEGELWDELDESPIKGAIKIDLGEPYGVITFQPRETYYGRVLDADAALEHFERTAQVEEFTQPKIVMSRVNELVRESLEQGKAIPDGLDFYAKRYVSISRQKD